MRSSGRYRRVGDAVTKFKVGDIAGIGCFVDSCRECSACEADQEQFCKVHCAATYNGTEMDEKTPTYGGYSKHHVVDEAYALKVSPDQPLAEVAPLLCAGITTYSPLRRFKVGPGSKVGGRRPRRARSHGRQTRRLDGCRSNGSQHLAVEKG